MKIVFVIKALNKIKGGAERVLCAVASGLADRGHQVTIISFDQPGGTPIFPVDQRVWYCPIGYDDPYHKTGVYESFRRIFRLRQTIKAIQPDVTVGFMHSAYVLLVWAMAMTGIPVIASEHIVPAYYRTRKIEFMVSIFSMLIARSATVVHPSLLVLYPKIIRRKMIALPNPVNVRSIDSKKKREADEKSLRVILNIGRFDPQKDQKTLISAFARLADRFPEWHVHLVGAGKLEADLIEQISNFGLEKRVKIFPPTDQIEVFYQNADLFVLPSLYESFGLVVAESLAYGVPVIGFSDCPGVNALIQNDQNGLLVASKDRVLDLAQGMETLMMSADKRSQFAANGPASVAAYGLDAVLNRWEELLSTVSRVA